MEEGAVVMDVYAFWIGYAILSVGGALLTLGLIGVAMWQALEWWYRRYCDVKHLQEFILWRRQRYPG